ncbi:hypothetical protein BDZ45DRAFT_256709 [Acephala macrosclerotiorum]|nr:hypothetical protein BDZ45DRAFT_256709 [Acephala macrosclerotiorum]
MSTRRPHKKSRNGCKQCRGRHAKCDEQHPSCSNCTYRLLNCSFKEASTPLAPVHPSQPQRVILPPLTPNNVLIPLGQSPASISNLSSNAEATDGNGDVYLDLKLIDLELLHHFSTVTYFSLGRTDEGRHIWQTHAIRVAFSHVFLLRGILAFSALHISSLRPEQDRSYLDRASEHHDKALEEFHSTLDNVNESNVEAAFLFSTLLVPHALALSRIDGHGHGHDNADTSSSIFDWLFLVRGVKVVLEPFRERIRNSMLGPLVRPMGNERVPDESIPELQKLREAFSQVTGERTKEAALAYTQAIYELEAVMAELRLSPTGKDLPDLGSMMVWIVKVSQHFSSCLRERTPEALIILAHFATTLRYRNDIWWLHGRDVQLIYAIEEQLPSEWKGWLEWPKSCSK